MKKKIGKFEMIISQKGIKVVDHRHKPPRKCGILSWRSVMNMIEEFYTEPDIHPAGFR